MPTCSALFTVHASQVVASTEPACCRGGRATVSCIQMSRAISTLVGQFSAVVSNTCPHRMTLHVKFVSLLAVLLAFASPTWKDPRGAQWTERPERQPTQIAAASQCAQIDSFPGCCCSVNPHIPDEGVLLSSPRVIETPRDTSPVTSARMRVPRAQVRVRVMGCNAPAWLL